MTKRKPPGASFGSWVDKQISIAEQRGDFENLPGAGKPLPKGTGRDAATEWMLRQVRDRNLDTSDMLPPSLALPKEIQDLPAKLAKERTEKRVREIVEDLNARILKAYREPQLGPPLAVAMVDVEEAVANWRESKAS
ncbi:DUF1992 domain-containing protein [Amycolatopsis sp. NPDC059027]|uniref:DnaJ family domain-containing protein n=1 Tax=unclassified Amycolatopsis TaxID=2618356 RepID=UPI003670E474